LTTKPERSLTTSDVPIAFRRVGSGPALILLHATLSSSRQLRPLASKLAPRFDVISVDRRGSGASVLPQQRAMTRPPEPIDVAVHVADLEALFEAEHLEPAIVAGHSYGGCIALEFAARRPDRVKAVWAYEPPYGPVGPPEAQQAMAQVARAVDEAARRGGPPAAAEAFMIGVSGRRAFNSLSGSSRERVRQAGPSAIADAALLGMDPDGLPRIDRPVVIAYGADSQPVYQQIANGLISRIPGAIQQRLESADHMAPIVRPEVISAEIEALADR
jgi:pimeloyl-ACP methyl ester carboxylesterase